jgi:hypothetical protein
LSSKKAAEKIFEQLMTKYSPTIFLLCSRRPIVAEFQLLAETVSAETDWRIVFVVPDGLREMFQNTLPQRSEIILTGHEAWFNEGLINGLMYGVFGLLRKVAQISRAFNQFLITDFLQTWEAVARGRWFAGRVLHVDRVGVAVLTADDRDIRMDQGILLKAKRHHVFCMTVAFGKSDPEADSGRRSQANFAVDQKPWKFLKQWTATKYPAGVRLDAAGNRLLFFRMGEYAALRMHSSLFPVPWSYGGGFSNRVAVPDNVAKKLLLRQGVPREKVFLAGQISHDILWESYGRTDEIRVSLNKRYQFHPERPLVVLAMPVLGEHGMISGADQEDEAKFLFHTLGELNAPNVLVSLHPRQSRQQYEFLAKKYGVHLAAEPLREVLAAADLFVAYSSTIAWAQLLGIPTLALEYHNLGYSLFAGQPGVRDVFSREHVGVTCEALLPLGAMHKQVRCELSEKIDRTTFDGSVRQRIIDEIRSHTKRV